MPAAWLARPIAKQEPGAERLALGQVAGLGEQVVGGVGVGRHDGVVGLEQAAGEGVVDLGEPVLAVGPRSVSASAREGLGGGEVAGGELDGGQLGAELGRPRTSGAALSAALRGRLRGGIRRPARRWAVPRTSAK